MMPRPTERSAHGGIGRLGEVGAGIVDETLQRIVEEAHHVLDEGRMLVPLEVGLDVERGEAADRGALACRDGRRRSAKVISLHRFEVLTLEAGEPCDARAIALFTWSTNTRYGSPVSMRAVRIANPQRARAESLRWTAPSFGETRAHSSSFSTATHEGVGNEKARGCRFGALRFGSPPVGRRISMNSSISGWLTGRIDGGRAATQRALGDRQRERIHGPRMKGTTPGGLAVHADLLTDRAQVAPIGGRCRRHGAASQDVSRSTGRRCPRASRLASFRKHEIGRPREGAAVRQDGGWRA